MKGQDGTTDYDAIVIGAGQAGPGVAAALADEGKRVALIEMEQVGGTCLNHGCKPTKALRASASRGAPGAHGGRVRSAHRRGDRRLRHRDRSGAPADRHDARTRCSPGSRASTASTCISGTATLQTRPGGRTRSTVGDRTLSAPEVYLNLGSRASEAAHRRPGRGQRTDRGGAAALTELPEHLIDRRWRLHRLEFGQMFRRFGAEVTMLVGSGVADPRGRRRLGR